MLKVKFPLIADLKQVVREETEVAGWDNRGALSIIDKRPNKEAEGLKE